MNTASVLGRDAEKLRSELHSLKAREVELESSLLEAGGQLASAKEDGGGKDMYIQEMSATHRAVLAKMRLGQEKLGKENAALLAKVERLMLKVEAMERVGAERDECKEEVASLKAEVKRLEGAVGEREGKAKGAERERERAMSGFEEEREAWMAEKESWAEEKVSRK